MRKFCPTLMAAALGLTATALFAADGPATQPAPPVMVLESRAIALSTENAAYLGVSVSPATATLREQLGLVKGGGLVVDFVEKDSPAQKAGVKINDVLTKLNDQILFDEHQLACLVRTFKGGDTVTLTALEQGKPLALPVVLAEKQQPVLADNNNPWMMTPPIIQRFGPADAGPNMGNVREQIGKALDGMPNQDELRKRIDEALRGVPELNAGGNHGEVAVPPNGPWHQAKIMTMTVTNGQRTFSDGENTLTLTTADGHEDHLVVKDKDGKVIFDGPVATDAQRQKLPPGIAPKLEMLKGSGVNIAIPAPAAPDKKLPDWKDQGAI